ncbi:MAG: histidine phosphatase family protein [Rhodobacteraceae bacterium]|nr:histidine phosphatase family protein [Paracoccaceae bacterium]
MTRLALIRHGHTSWNRAGRIQGRSDIPLDDQARVELAAQRLPAPWSDAVLWSSPMIRAVDTARLISDRDPKTDPALTEMNWGDFEGGHGKDLIADPNSGYRHIEDWGWDFRPPNGESPLEIWQRLKPWIAGLTGDNVAVCHIGIMRVILARAHGWDFDGPAPFKVKRNRLFIVDIAPDGMIADPDPVRLDKRDTPA